MSHSLVSFYEGVGQDQSGRTFEEVLLLDDVSLEESHDFIQWLFPTRQRSAFNEAAPVLDDDTIALLKAKPKVGYNIRRALGRMRAFLQLDWTHPHPRWMHPRDHNTLRVTRILTSLGELGFTKEAMSLFQDLRRMDPDKTKAGSEAWSFWVKALHDHKVIPSEWVQRQAELDDFPNVVGRAGRKP